MSKVFGKNKSGKITICRAKPENRGRYGCTHSEHYEFTEEELSTGIIQKLNEEFLSKQFQQPSLSRNQLPEQYKNKYSNTVVSEYIEKEELIKDSLKLSQNFDPKTFEFIRNFYSRIEENLMEPELLRKENDEQIQRSIQNIHGFLVSEDPSAKRIRRFLGPIDLKNFSEILVLQVGSMTSRMAWSGRRGKSSIRRAVLTSLNNDMDKNRYTASVTFFGGRCCYCNTPLQKGPPPEKQASGEHLTPISPGKNGVVGSTKFGNMALSCISCNKERGNKSLKNFIQTTSRIPKEEKALVLARIRNFRNFALYSDYSKEYSDKVEKVIDEISEFEQRFRNPDGSFTKNIRDEIRKKIKLAVYDLQTEHF